MAGSDQRTHYDVLGVPRDEYEAMAAIAVGYPGDAESLPDDLKAREHPSSRKPASEFAFRGRYTTG